MYSGKSRFLRAHPSAKRCLGRWKAQNVQGKVSPAISSTTLKVRSCSGLDLCAKLSELFGGPRARLKLDCLCINLMRSSEIIGLAIWTIELHFPGTNTCYNIYAQYRDGKGTVKLTKKHSTFKRGMLSQLTAKTLGSGNMKAAVMLPEGEDRCEWIAANTVDFFNELSLLYGLVSEQAQEKYSKPGDGFPSGFEYRWADGSGKP